MDTWLRIIFMVHNLTPLTIQVYKSDLHKNSLLAVSLGSRRLKASLIEVLKHLAPRDQHKGLKMNN